MFLENPIIVTGVVVALLAGVFALWLYATRRRVAAVIMLSFSMVGLLVVGVASPASAATLLYPNPNPIGSTSVLNRQLPTCSGMTAKAKGDEMAGQGWTGDWQLPMQIGTRTAWAVLMLPCYSNPLSPQTGAVVYPQWFALETAGTGLTATPAVTIYSIAYDCDGAVRSASGYPQSANGSINLLNVWSQTIRGESAAFCTSPFSTLTSVSVAWGISFNGTIVTGTARWDAVNWGTGEIRPKPANIGAVPFPGGAQETPVVCNYAVDTTDVLTVLATFLPAVGPWFACLWIPSGWDRSGQIAAGFQTTGISRVQSAMVALVPTAGTVVCGELSELPVWGTGVPLDTCSVAGAVPFWAKEALAGLAALALLRQFYRRVQWTLTDIEA